MYFYLLAILLYNCGKATEESTLSGLHVLEQIMFSNFNLLGPFIVFIKSVVSVFIMPNFYVF